MNISIKTQNVSLSPAVTDYVDKRMNSIAKFLGDAEPTAQIYVQIGKTNGHHRAGDNLFATEINVDAGAIHIRAEAFDADLYASIDKVRDEAVRELTSVKKKKVTILRRSGLRLKNMLRGLYSRE